jgi:hypothetical protein
MQVGGAVVMGSDVPTDRYQTAQGFAVSLQLWQLPSATVGASS